MTVVIALLFIIVLFFFLNSIYNLVLPTKCSKCRKTLIKGYVKRIGVSPYCRKCYNEILKENTAE